jgi:predicted dehydrogenase
MIKGCLVGLGRMGITHFSILNAHPSVEIRAICDRSNRMLNIWKKYTNLNIYSDHRTMFRDEALDFVIISTPTDSHSEIIKAALDSSLHVFVEKPLSINAEQAIATNRYLEGKNLVGQVGYVNRFNEVFVEVKKLLASRVIGDIKTFTSEMYGPTVLKDSKGSWRGKRATGGGCMFEFASHCIDLAVYLVGVPERVTGSILKSIYSSDVEDFVSSTFIYGDGPVGSITVNWSEETYRKPTNIVKILGARGKIIADKHAYKIFLKEDDSTNGFRKGWNTRYITDFGKSVRLYVRGNEFTRQLDSFIECIENGVDTHISSFSDAMKTDIIMEEITKDAEGIATGTTAIPRPLSETTDHAKSPSLWKRLRG